MRESLSVCLGLEAGTGTAFGGLDMQMDPRRVSGDSFRDDVWMGNLFFSFFSLSLSLSLSQSLFLSKR